MTFLKSGLISRFGVMRTMMALLAIAMSLIGLTVVGLGLGMGITLFAVAGAVVVLQFHEVGTVKSTVLASFVAVAAGLIVQAMLGASVITMAEVGLYALIGLVTSGFTWFALAAYAKLDRLPGIEHAGRFGHDNVDTHRNRPSSTTVTHIRPRSTGALAA